MDRKRRRAEGSSKLASSLVKVSTVCFVFLLNLGVLSSQVRSGNLAEYKAELHLCLRFCAGSIHKANYEASGISVPSCCLKEASKLDPARQSGRQGAREAAS